MVRRLICLVIALPMLAAGRASLAQETGAVDHAREYTACMTLAQVDPEEAFESALVWQTAGGGDGAQHCAAVALIGLGHYKEAAERLERLGEAMATDDDALRADTFGQAGQAWLLAGDNERAHAAQSAALELTPDDVELLVDRSLTLATAQNYWEAIDDLNRALELAPDRADILIFRASAYRYVDALELAGEDIERALELQPENPEGRLERGNLRRLLGDHEGARDDWLAVTRQAEGTPAAEAAQSNLEALDVKVE